MPDYGQDLRFGVFLTPEADQAETVLELAVLADTAGLDLVTVQDHPYQARFLDTWTLLSVIAARTTNVAVAPNVANLPLRPPVVLARSVASLDRLSGGRVELGLGAGAFWEAIVANGGPRRTPGESLAALSEAIDVIRGLWSTDSRSIRHEGEHYRVVGAHTGPAPAHRVEIWVGAYRPRILRLVGARADGWLPSLGYIRPSDLGPMSERIDEAAAASGRAAVDVRRLLNIGRDFLDGPPARSAEALAELTLAHGTSTFIAAVTSAGEIRRFAEDVAPAVRELVDDERGGDHVPAPVRVAAEPTRFALVPTPDDRTRLAAEAPWDEATRPTGPPPDPARGYTREQQAAGQHLIDVHDALRAELRRLRDLVEQVGSGTAEPATVRSFVNRMTIRQNNWTLGAFCESYCRVIGVHHTLEDRSVFPHLRRGEPGLALVIDRLVEEHEVIADILDRVDRALVDFVSDGGAGLQPAIDLLTDALLSHFSYEERELVEPLARHGFY